MSAGFTWLGHSTFRIDTPGGKVILIDPWVANNPACPDSEKEFDRMDLMLCTHGHYDHIGDAVPLAIQHKPAVVGIFELGHWLARRGVENIYPMNKGGTLQYDGIGITMVHADHSCGLMEEDGSIGYGGEPCGFVVTLEDRTVFYHAGDTAVFGDMRIIADIYKPTLAMLPIGDRFTMSPREAALACELLGCDSVIPMHHGTFDLLTGKPEELRRFTRHMSALNIVELEPGQSYVLSGAESGLG